MLLAILPMSAQRTTRKGLKVDKEMVLNPKGPLVPDTVYIDSQTGMGKKQPLAVSGYEKTLRSRRESFLLTNNTDDLVLGITFDIEYFDMNRRQLHQRTLTVKCDIPPAETRMVEFKSWDAQLVWYYYLSDKPRTRGQATPYKTIIHIKSYVTDKNR